MKHNRLVKNQLSSTVLPPGTNTNKKMSSFTCQSTTNSLMIDFICPLSRVTNFKLRPIEVSH